MEALRESEEWKLFMAYFDLADLMGHVYIAKRPLRLMHAYLELDALARNLQAIVPDSLFLIVSDHGMKVSEDGVSGTHTDYAFWSLNVETDWSPSDFTDFYPKILEWVKM